MRLQSRIGTLWVGLGMVLAGVSAAQAEIQPTFLMDQDPELQVAPPVPAQSPRLPDLWEQALSRPEVEMQWLAADAIARGPSAGVSNLQRLVPRLVELLSADNTAPRVRIAAARALVALDARDTADALAVAARRHQADLMHAVEPAFAAWQYQPFVADWEARLENPDYRPREAVLAMRCLARIGHFAAAGRLLEIMHQPWHRKDIRLAAVRAVAQLRDAGLESHTRRFMAETDTTGFLRICAVELLARHSSAESQTLLLEFAVDPQPAVANAAWRRLLELDPQLVLPLVDNGLRDPDGNIRRRAFEACRRLPSPERTTKLLRLLADPDPELRRSVTSALRDLAERPELDGPIRTGALEWLDSTDWRGQEQAILLLGALDHETCAPRLLQLLDAPRVEIEVAAAWALKSLAVADTLPVVLTRVTERTRQRKAHEPVSAGIDAEVAHLFELLGKLKYAAAEELFREQVPKQFDVGYLSRGAAVWALGYLHEGVPDEKLAGQLMARALDFGKLNDPPEMLSVRQMSMVTLGRMRAASRAEDIRAMLPPGTVSSRDAEIRRWALIQVTGEQVPELPPDRPRRSDWFLDAVNE